MNRGAVRAGRAMGMWVACNLVGLLTSAALVLALRMPDSPYGSGAAFLILVLPTTIAQWLLLRRLLGISPLWMLTIPLGCLLFVGLVAAIPPTLWRLVDDEGTGTLSTLYALMGFLVGALQWLILRRHLRASWIWIAASAAGLGLGFALVLSSNLIDLSEFAGYLAVFAVYSLLSGRALAWMLSRSALSADASVLAA